MITIVQHCFPYWDEALDSLQFCVYLGKHVYLEKHDEPRPPQREYTIPVAMGREKTMDEVATKIVDILKKNMKEPPETIALDTKLSDLEIESLDLAVIVFDIEDAFNIQIPYNANEEVQDFSTVSSVVDRVKALIAQKAVA